MKKATKSWVIIYSSGLLLIIVIFTGFFLYQSTFQKNSSTKPLTEKWGTYINISDSKGFVREQLEVAHQVGFKYVRIPVDQLPFESEYDKKVVLVQYAIDEAIDEKMIPIINFTGGTPGNFSGDQYQQIIIQLKHDISHFIKNNSDKGIIWEAWNEPNGAFWVNNGIQSPQVTNDWISFDDTIAKLVRKYDKHSLFISGDLEGNPQVNKDLLVKIRRSSSFKKSVAVSFHPYLSKTDNNGRPESLLRSFPRYTNTNPYVVTEFGYSVPTNSRVYEQRLGIWTYKQQAAYLTRAVLIMDEKGMPFFTLFNTSNKITNYGIENNGKLNLAGKELKSLGHKLRGYHFESRVETSNDRVLALKYSKQFAPSKIVYWSSDDQTILAKVSGIGNVTAKMQPQIHVKETIYYELLIVILLSIIILLCCVKWISKRKSKKP
ncbi:hypothetical protein N692_05435 [Lactiplantibacillus plantarum EGD-AQ4]|nr:hypothetical protein N692_05435 [Lactiplantibacillus plantarum EGD-AQ4]